MALSPPSVKTQGGRLNTYSVGAINKSTPYYWFQ